eukprot:SAG31_NODE_15474_length_753_cov_1.113150_1_plen_194_part_00
MEQISAGASGRLLWVGYLSSVGVYGDQSGADVDESTNPRQRTARAKKRRAAEQQWELLFPCEGHSNISLQLIRLPGIYGPHRGPISKVRAGAARCLVKPGQLFTRIHVDDIALAICSMCILCPGGVLNMVDDEPTEAHIVTENAAALLRVSPPPRQDFQEASKTGQLSAILRSFYAESRRIGNSKLKTLLKEV